MPIAVDISKPHAAEARAAFRRNGTRDAEWLPRNGDALPLRVACLTVTAARVLVDAKCRPGAVRVTYLAGIARVGRAGSETAAVDGAPQALALITSLIAAGIGPAVAVTSGKTLTALTSISDRAK
jgi:hypothetical protein